MQIWESKIKCLKKRPVCVIFIIEADLDLAFFYVRGKALGTDLY